MPLVITPTSQDRAVLGSRTIIPGTDRKSSYYCITGVLVLKGLGKNNSSKCPLFTTFSNYVSSNSDGQIHKLKEQWHDYTMITLLMHGVLMK